jgi:hypothetical protein
VREREEAAGGRDGNYFGLGCSTMKGKKKEEGMIMLSSLCLGTCAVCMCIGSVCEEKEDDVHSRNDVLFAVGVSVSVACKKGNRQAQAPATSREHTAFLSQNAW